MLWNVKCYEMSKVMKCQMTNVRKWQTSWNVKRHEMSNVMKCQTSWNVKHHETSNIMKCQKSRNVKSQLWWNNLGHENSNQKHQALHTSERTIVPRAVIFAFVTLCCWKISFFFVECRPLLTRGGGLQTSNFGWHNMWTVPIVFAFLPSCLTQRHS